jgi:serine/threonine protein kinase
MEYLHYGDLEKYLSNPDDLLPQDEVQDIVSQIAEGIYFMHENRFAHRDLKPAVGSSL